MSERYTEQSVVLLKREVERLVADIGSLIKTKEQYSKEVDAIESELRDKLANRTKIISGYNDVFVPYFNRLRNEEQRLISSIEKLSSENKSISKINSTVRSELNSIEVKKPKYTFVEQVTENLREELDSLGSAILEKNEQKTIAIREAGNDTKELSELKEEINRLKPILEKLHSDIKVGNDKNGKLGLEYMRLQRRITNIKTREHNIHTMEKRLLPKYRKLYSGKLCAKCGNPI